MNTCNGSNRNHPFLHRLKAFLERNRMHCTEEQMGGTTVLHVTRKTPVLPPLHELPKKGVVLPAGTLPDDNA